MKIRNVTSNYRRNEFTVVTRSGTTYTFPYTEADPQPNTDDRIEEAFVDKELGNAAVARTLMLKISPGLKQYASTLRPR